MIRCTVNARYEPVIRFSVRGPSGKMVSVDAIFDSGFSSALTLPLATVAELELKSETSTTARLGDGTLVRYDLYRAEIEWEAEWREVIVAGIGREVLLGAFLVIGHEVRIEYLPAGAVEIAPLPTFPL